MAVVQVVFLSACSLRLPLSHLCGQWVCFFLSTGLRPVAGSQSSWRAKGQRHIPVKCWEVWMKESVGPTPIRGKGTQEEGTGLWGSSCPVLVSPSHPCAWSPMLRATSWCRMYPVPDAWHLPKGQRREKGLTCAIHSARSWVASRRERS